MLLRNGLGDAGDGDAGVQPHGVLVLEVAGCSKTQLLCLMVLLSRPGQAKGITAVSLFAIAVFGAAHGYAHAAEATGAALPYLAGVLTATAILHLAGLGLARLVQAGPSAGAVQRALGSAITACGLVLAAG